MPCETRYQRIFTSVPSVEIPVVTAADWQRWKDAMECVILPFNTRDLNSPISTALAASQLQSSWLNQPIQMSPGRALSLAQGALHTPNGGKKALRYLEEEVVRSGETGNDAGVWACIAHLRRKQGDFEGGDKAERKAREIADSNVQPRRLSFGDADEFRGRETEKETETEKEEKVENDQGLRCRELLDELGVDVKPLVGRAERLLERTKRLRKVSEGLLRGGCVEFG